MLYVLSSYKLYYRGILIFQTSYIYCNYLDPKWLNTIIEPVSFSYLPITSVSAGMKIHETD